MTNSETQFRKNMSYHKVSEDAQGTMVIFRRVFAKACFAADSLIPHGREKALFRTKCEEAQMHGIAAIARHHPDSEIQEI